MSKKVKIISLFIFLLILILLAKISLNVKVIKYSFKYNNNKVYIEERLDNNEYVIKILYLDKKYLLRLDKNLSEKRKLINKIYYFKDDSYECLLPVINNNIYTDFMCYSKNVIYNYQYLFGKDKSLDDYVSSVNIYNKERYYDDLSKVKYIDGIKFYKNNINNINASISTYDGIISLDEHIKLFNQDAYNNNLSAFVDNYYIVADYNSNYEFKEFYVVDLSTNKVFKIKSKYEISFDSYIEGVVDNKLYLYDKDNENQYEIDIKNKKIKIVSTDDKIRYYKNNKWEMVGKSKASNDLYFDYTSLSNLFLDYDKVLETEKYYYLFLENNDEYMLYRMDKLDTDILTFITNIKTNEIILNDDYFYFVYKNKLYYYSDDTNLKTILEYNELEYNDTIKYYISKTYF